MPVRIRCKGKQILQCRGSTLEFLYNYIDENVVTANVQLSSSLKGLLDYFYQACFGVGFDIADHVTKKKDMILFLKLLKNSIERYFKEFPNLSNDIKDAVNNFYNKLVKYSKELE